MDVSLIYHVLLAMVCLVQTVKLQDPIATTQYGQIRGYTTINEDSTVITRFLGIPFAKAPINELRFKKTEQFEKNTIIWDQPFNATKLGDSCFSLFTPIDTVFPDEVDGSGSTYMQNEDCLYMNVFYPGDFHSRNDALKSVMVFIYGGGYMDGSGNIYSGTGLALTQDIIYVTFNYRLGLFGFASTEDGTVPGNMGLFDQHAALEWVKENIDAFGGDSETITIFGESAGADSVLNHVASPLSSGLFKRAISQSPFAYNKPMRSVQAFVVKLLVQPHCESSEDVLRCLQSLTPEQIKNLGVEPLFQLYSLQPVIIDGHFLQDDPMKLFKQGRYNQSIDVMVGFNGDDGDTLIGSVDKEKFNNLVTYGIEDRKTALLQVKEAWYVFFQKEWDDAPNSNIILDIIEGEYFQDDSRFGLARGYINILTHQAFASPVLNVIDSLSNHGGNCYLYVFDYRSEDFSLRQNLEPNMEISAFHGEDIFYVFGAALLGQEEPRLIASSMMTAWATFAKTGQPQYLTSSMELTPWKPYMSESNNYFWIKYPLTESSGSEFVSPELLSKTRLWISTLLHINSLENTPKRMSEWDCQDHTSGSTSWKLSNGMAVVLSLIALAQQWFNLE